MNGDIAMRFERVSVRFQRRRRVADGAFTALHEIDLDVLHGERLGIIGRNGAGKSTLLRIMAGVLKPDAGRVVRNHGRCQLLALGVGFMPALTGRENAVLSGLLQGLDRRTVVSRLEEICEFSELGTFFDEPLSTYSTGMVARLGFAVAMENHPDILLIDEVLSVGDADFQAKSTAALRRRLEEGATAVLVSHSEQTLLEVCDRIVWLDGGKVVDVGEPQAMIETYLAASVAS